MIATKKNKKRLTALLSLLVIMLSGLLIAIPTTTKASALEFHGINVDNVDYITGYYMKIGLKDLKVNQNLSLGHDALSGIKDTFARTEKDITLIFNFMNLKYVDENNNTKNLAFMGVVRASIPASLWGNMEIVFKEDITISLTNNHYKYLKKLANPDYSNLYLSVYGKNGTANSILHDKDFKKISEKITLFEDPNIPIENIDPDSDDFDPDFGNTGDGFIPEIPTDKNPVVTPKTPKTSFNLFQALADLFGTTKNNVIAILCLVGCGIGALVIVGVATKK